jgi:hypothetical protein
MGVKNHIRQEAELMIGEPKSQLFVGVKVEE